MTIEDEIKWWRQAACACDRRDELIVLLLAERDTLKRVVSAPEARATTSAAEADLGPVSAPGAPVPYCCPVCEGRGIVPPQFYVVTRWQGFYGGTSTAPEQCRACCGTGLLWTGAEAARAAVAAQGEPSRSANTKGSRAEERE